MGQTNVRSAGDLLRGASNYHFANVVLVPEAGNVRIHKVSGASSQDEVAKYSTMLQLTHPMQNRWLTADYKDWLQVVPRFAIPQTFWTPGLTKFWMPDRLESDQKYPQPVGLTFIAIVQGSTGAALQKAYTASSREAIGISIFHEAINGYSTVFSGAFFKADLELARHRSIGDVIEWIPVENLEKLVQVRQENEDLEAPRAMVAIVC